jgi:hypothetical protein
MHATGEVVQNLGNADVPNIGQGENIRGLNFVRFEFFTAVTMKNAVFWDIKTQFVLHRRHITYPLQSPAS